MLAKLGFGKKNAAASKTNYYQSTGPSGVGGPTSFASYGGHNSNNNVNYNGNGPASNNNNNNNNNSKMNHRRKKKPRQSGGAMTYNFDPQQKLSILGLENVIRRSWNVGSVVRVIHNNNFEIANILSVKGDILHLLLDDGKTLKKTDRWSMEVQPMDTSDVLGLNENKSGEFDSDDESNNDNSNNGGITGYNNKKKHGKKKSKRKNKLKSKSHKYLSDDDDDGEGEGIEGVEGGGTITRAGTTTSGFGGYGKKKKKKKKKRHKSKHKNKSTKSNKSSKSKRKLTDNNSSTRYESKDDSKDDFKDDEKFMDDEEDSYSDESEYSYETDDSDFDESSLMYYGYNEDELLKAAIEASLNEVQRLCGYTIWVQWCDSQELHGYYHCNGFKNNKYAFTHKKDKKAELMADPQGYWHLMYDKKVLYKSGDPGEDPPPRGWICMEGSLPPPGVSMVELPDQHSPMVVIDKKKLENARRNPTQIAIGLQNNDNTASAMLSAATGNNKSKRKSASKKKNKKDKREKKDIIKELENELHLPLQVMRFDFDGSKPVAFHLNIQQRMEVTKVKEEGQAAQLGVKQGDILIKINEEDISTDWDKATGMLRSCMMKKEMFSITFCRRMVEYLFIFVARAGIEECNGKYQFYKRDPTDDDCPIFVKVRNNPVLNEDIFDNNDPLEDPSHDEVLTDPSNLILQRVFSDPENNEALWVIKNGKDEHFYIAMTNEYLPPQQSWDLAPEGKGKYPAPGLKFHTKQTKFVTKMLPQEVEAERHDVLNVTNRTRNNRHMHKKTLIKMQRAMSNMQEISQQRKGAAGAGVKTIGNNRAASGIVTAPYGAGAGGKIGGIGGVAPAVTTTGRDTRGDSLFSPTGSDSRAEALWQKKIEDISKRAIGQLQSQHKEELSRKQSRFEAEISKKKSQLENAQTRIDDLCERLNDANEFYYELYLEKCNLSLALFDTMEDVSKQKQKAKEIAKSYYAKIDETEELRAQITELTESYSSRIVALHNQNTVATNQLKLANRTSGGNSSSYNNTKSKGGGKRRGKKKNDIGSDSDSLGDDVDLADLEKQFLSLTDVTAAPNRMMSVEDHDRQVALEDEVYDLKTQLDSANMRIQELEEESQTWQDAHEDVWQTLQDRDKRLAELEGSEMYHKNRSMMFKEKASNFERKIYDLMALLQNVENEYNQRLGNLPPSSRNVDWRKEYDPKLFKSSFDQYTYGSGGDITANININTNIPQIENSKENYYDTSSMRQSGAIIDSPGMNASNSNNNNNNMEYRNLNDQTVQSFSKRRSKRGQSKTKIKTKSKSKRKSQLQQMQVEGDGLAQPASPHNYSMNNNSNNNAQYQQYQQLPQSQSQMMMNGNNNNNNSNPNRGGHKSRMSKIADL